MRRSKRHIARWVSCIFLMSALAWLTVSLPVVYQAQQTAQEKKAAQAQSEEEETGNPLSNTNEEKTPGGTGNFNEEYLHDSHCAEHFITEISYQYHIEHYATYIAFYGDLETPPPDQA